MENYPEHIYPTLLKDGDGETFHLQQTCDALQKILQAVSMNPLESK